MKNMDPIFLIYHFENSGGESPHYSIVRVFSELGDIPYNDLENVYEKVFHHNFSEGNSDLGYFESLADLNRFGQELIIELEKPQINIISTQEYNNSIGSVFNLDAYKEMLLGVGTQLFNREIQSGKSNFFKKIFRD